MYGRKKGKSGSKKPIGVKHSWLRYDAKEIEQLILKLANTGKTSAEIGLILRDSYGIPSVKAVTNKKILKILSENKLNPKLPEDITALVKRHIVLMKHMESNKKDLSAKRGSIITESKIHKLAKYYIRHGVLPDNWKYDRTKAKMLVG